MAGFNVDIALSEELQQALSKPVCSDLKLPKPSIPQLQMPNGPIIKPIADFTKGIPDDCSMAFNLLAQVGPIMVSIECLMRIMALIEPLTKIIKALTAAPPRPDEAASAAPDFIAAADKLVNCLLMISPPNILVFLRDLINLIAKLLRCLVEQLQSVLDMTTNLAIKIKTAEDAGDTGLAETLECAMENADLTTQGLLGSVESLAAILSLITPFLELAGKEVEIPSMEIADTSEIDQVLETLHAVATGLEEFAESLGAE
jgi:hypothetical protein